MRTLLLLFVALSLLALPGRAADLAAAKAGAEATAKALQRDDFAAVLSTTHPKVIELGGGKENMLRQVTEAAAGMKKGGLKIVSVTIGKPGEPIRGEAQVFSIVPMVLKVDTPKSLVTTYGYLLAVSEDDGTTWTYIDGSGLTMETLHMLFSNLPKALELPAKKPPTVAKK